MKCKFIRDDMEVSPQFRAKCHAQYVAMKADGDIVERSIMRDGKVQPVEFLRKGAVLEHPNAWMDVEQGTAIPADLNCALKCGLTEDEMKVKQIHYELLVNRLQPEDEDLLVNGVVTGMDVATGNYIPGPNWDRLEEFRPLATFAAEDEGEDV